jgi:phenylalanyl-tRNA synthetase alpha chain
MQQDLENMVSAAHKAISAVDDLQALDEIRVQYLGKKGSLTDILKGLGTLSAEERPLVGQRVNEAKEHIKEKIDQRFQDLQQQALEKKLSSQRIDVTLPGRGESVGTSHPISQVRDRVETIFKSMGFKVAEGPEIENEYYNFTALNIPEHHPARAVQDTFYLEDGNLLRTHTSPIQIHVMESQKPPIRIITPGRVFRHDYDHTHTPMFHQIEMVVIDEHTTFSDLKGILTDFLHQFFESQFELRFRASYFPFTEPSAEVDIQCVKCRGAGCRICKGTGWLEILGCGMVHPNVLAACKIDSERYQGCAFGMGLERLAMLHYGIDDIRLLFENDLRFLRQF